MNATIYLEKVRLSFPKLVEASTPPTFPTADKKFGCDLVMPKEHPGWMEFMKIVNDASSEEWKGIALSVMKQIYGDRKLRCFGSGDEKLRKETMLPYDGYAGNMYISASAREEKPPQIIRPSNGEPATNPIERQELARNLYGGCYVNAAISVWLQDNQFGRAIRCNLLAVQFHSDAQPFGDAPPDFSTMFKPTQSDKSEMIPSWM